VTKSESARVIVIDREDNDHTESVDVPPGDYCLVVTRPLRLVNEQRYANGTIVLTLKREERKEPAGGQDGDN
jgi:hypothetical protein